MRVLPLLARATSRSDRVVMVVSGVVILALAVTRQSAPGERAVIYRDNRPVLTLSLDQDRKQEVSGRLGPVVIQVEQGRIRLLEYASPRLIGTRTGWIRDAGQTAACVPCGIVIQVTGKPRQSSQAVFDAVSE